MLKIKWLILLSVFAVCTVDSLSFLNVLRTLTETPAVGFAGVRVVVLVDNNPYKHGLETAWGLSLYVEVNETYFLFDAGPNPRVLGVNAVRLGVDLSRVGFAVLTAPRYSWRGFCTL
jgi:hypothetical protein